MMYTFEVKNLAIFKQKALQWGNQFEVMAYLDSNHYANDAYSNYDCLIAIGAKEVCQANVGDAFRQLANFQVDKDWIFGFLTYDLKNETEALSSDNLDELGFPDLYFFQPIYLLLIKGQEISLLSEGAYTVEKLRNAIETYEMNPPKISTKKLALKRRMSEAEYIAKVKAVKEHIVDGDLYEMNLCMEFYSEQTLIHPLDVFTQLNESAQAPFSAFFKLHHQYAICSSPERFMKKQANLLISQPIKGTAKRGQNPKEDDLLKTALFHDKKERAENVMIVDLVRNDLTRSAEVGSIKVDELFGTYSFQTVHHLISTVSARIRSDVHWAEAIKNAFPMGSMTGAPKIMAMQLIEQYEESRRGLYSGAIGYVTGDNNFDFNVVIRSILYNQDKEYLSFQVGSAITYESDPQKEYQECLLKAANLIRVLQSDKK